MKELFEVGTYGYIAGGFLALLVKRTAHTVTLDIRHQNGDLVRRETRRVAWAADGSSELVRALQLWPEHMYPTCELAIKGHPWREIAALSGGYA